MQTASLVLLLAIFQLIAVGQDKPHRRRRPVTVNDAITYARLADPQYLNTGNSMGRVAQFSPDGRRFVVILRKGDLKARTNDYSVYLFRTSDVFHTTKADILLTMSSSSNRDAISQLRWLPDSQHIAFLGESAGKCSQIYIADIATRRVKQLTHQATPIVSYAISGGGRDLSYLAESPKHANAAIDDNAPIHITSQKLPDLLGGKFSLDADLLQLFVVKRTARISKIKATTSLARNMLSLSPNGRFGLVAHQLRSSELPQSWKDYDYGKNNDIVRTYFNSSDGAAATPFVQYLLLDTHKQTLVPLDHAPHLGYGSIAWSRDGRAVFLKDTYLPTDDVSATERAERLKQTSTVKITVPDRSCVRASTNEFPGPVDHDPISIVMREDVNHPPKIYARSPLTQGESLLIDLNPQLSELDLGKVESVTWNVHGIPVIGGLYYPPDYDPARKYPLVIQTHGYNKDQFSMDGRSEWSSGFAARPLAAKGMLVLQAYDFVHPKDHDLVADDRSLGKTEREAFRTFADLAYESAIDSLLERGLIDQERIGISGFSRTVWFVAYTLTHPTHKYSAAILTDGIDGGYFQYLSFRATEFEDDNGGNTPFDKDGLAEWLRVSPSFNLASVDTPVRLMSLDTSVGILEAWEWFAGLTLQKKPVDFVSLRDGTHLLQKVRDRQTAMDGIVDWFDFWLNGHADPSPLKRTQYIEWMNLRSMQILQTNTSPNNR